MAFLTLWLTLSPVPAYDGLLQVDELAITGQLDDAEVRTALGHELRRNYLGRETLETLSATFEDLAAPEVAKYLRANVLPGTIRVRHGEFGEALTGAHFRTVRRYCMPVLKLRYKQGPDQPVFGADVLAFRLREEPPVIAVPEVKTLTTRDPNIGIEGYKSLQKVLGRLDQSVHFVVARLAERGQSALAGRVAALLRGARQIERHIVVVQEASCWDDRVVERLQAEMQQPVRLTVLRLAGLRELIAGAYDAAAEDLSRGA